MKRRKTMMMALVAFLSLGLTVCCGSGSDSGGPRSCSGSSCPGSTTPDWVLEDFQPESSKVGQTYGLSEFRGRVLVVALLAGW